MILNLIRSLLIAFVFWILTGLSSTWGLLPFHLLRFFHQHQRAYDYLTRFGQIMSRLAIFIFGSKLHIEGYESIPIGRNYCFIANHQAYADILLFMAATPRAPGYIARKSLSRVPFINWWMKAYGCYFLERNSLKDGMKAILFGIERIKNGYPMVIFPEGTRSKSSKMGEFKKGSLKLATKAKTLIVPVSIEGTYRIYEETGFIQTSCIAIRFHPPIDVSQLSSEEEDNLSDTLYYIIQNGVNEIKAKTPQFFC